MGNNYTIPFECPYYNSNAKLTIRCECGVLRFRTKGEIKRFIHRYCASFDGYHNCTLCQSRDQYYDEIYGGKSNAQT